jgi:hypothetical protein
MSNNNNNNGISSGGNGGIMPAPGQVMGKPMEGAFQAMNTPLREDLIDKVWYILI